MSKRPEAHASSSIQSQLKSPSPSWSIVHLSMYEDETRPGIWRKSKPEVHNGASGVPSSYQAHGHSFLDLQNAGRSPGQVPPPQISMSRMKSSGSERLHLHRHQHVPHKGEHFSVDDDTSEVEQDRATRVMLASGQAFTGRRQALIRRKSHHQEQKFSPHKALPEVEVEDTAEATGSGARTQGNISADEEEEEMNSLLEQQNEPSETASFTLEDRQQAINETHPFGIRIWQPALYKEEHASELRVEEDTYSLPFQIVSTWLWGFNVLWTILFGWWLATLTVLGPILWFQIFRNSSIAKYRVLLRDLARYLFWPFGKVVYLHQDDNYADDDAGEGRSFREYQQWQEGRIEYGRLMFGRTLPHADALNERQGGRYNVFGGNDNIPPYQQEDETSQRNQIRLFGHGRWTCGRVLFFLFFYCCLAPLLLLVAVVCWLMVFWLPMNRIIFILLHHLRRRPLALSFEEAALNSDGLSETSSILICTYRAVGPDYWKYSVNGINIFLFNSLGIVAFVILDYLALKEVFNLDCFLTTPITLFSLAVVAVIPLTYVIGEAVASISAQSSMGMAATINAFFSTIIEVTLYCIALQQEDSALVQGSVIGSLLGGILLMPGLSMCFGALKRKTQRFNVQSTRATNSMLLFATIAAFGPTVFYKITGSYMLICGACGEHNIQPTSCQRCYYRQDPAADEELFKKTVQPFTWLAAVLLFSSYMTGLLFTLRTHATVIWTTDTGDRKASTTVAHAGRPQAYQPPNRFAAPNISARGPIQNSHVSLENAHTSQYKQNVDGHNVPNWSRKKSAIILFSATITYAIVAKILVDNVDFILASTNVDEKTLGLTLFALLPNTTEFIDAISFAMNENIALSMEIGSAYALQVCLLQIPALVLFSTLSAKWGRGDAGQSMFKLVFPMFDIISVFLCVMLLSYLSGEGTSNYFKGSMLLLAYSLVLVGLYLGGHTQSEW